jgi:predicted acetyltransferase
MKPEIRHTKFSIGWKTECLLEDEVVSHLWINDRTMRIGSARLRIGGIGGVGTDRKHRNRGYSKLCMEAATELMSLKGYDLAFLFGIRDFYDKYGYITCMPEHTFTMDTRNA